MEQLSNRVGGHGAGISENKQFIIRDREVIDLHTIKIKENGDKIQETGLRMGDAEVSILAQQKQLDENGERISSAEFRLNGAEAKILLKVNKDGVIAAINLTPEEAKIQALKINLEGYVTAKQLEAELENIELSFNERIYTNTLQANSVATGEFTLSGTRMSKINKTFLTGAKISVGKATARVMHANGSPMEITYVSSVTISNSDDDIYYVGYY